MAGTRAGGLKAAATNRRRHGADFYARIGSRGGSAPTAHPKGFANPHVMCDCERYAKRHHYNRCASSKGGRVSRRGRHTAEATR